MDLSSLIIPIRLSTMMTKSKIITLVLKELNSRFDLNPESFECSGIGELNANSSYSRLPGENLVWSTKVLIDGALVDDPTNSPKTVIVNFSSYEKTITIKILNGTWDVIDSSVFQVVHSTVSESHYFMALSINYYHYKKLRKKISNKYKHLETKSFLKRLSTVFPSILDSHILGK